jgi:glycosyltransferase involved in cell wall biosynthesis
MRVGVFLDSYIPEDGGGYTMQSELFRALCKVHSQTEHEFVILSHPDRQLESEVGTANMSWLPITQPGLMEKSLAFVVRLWPKLRSRLKWRSSLENKARRAGIEYIWFLGPRAHSIDLPYLTIVLDLQHRKQPWFPEVRDFAEWETRERLTKNFLQRAAGIIAGTEVGKQEIIKFYGIPANRIFCLPHPTPRHVIEMPKSSEIWKRFNLSPGFLLYPAQFWPHKNHVNLLIALEKLSDQGIKIPLVLTGSDFGNQSFVEAKIQEFKLTDQLRILGFVSQEELVGIYQNALALTYVSYFGPENLPPLEAFALGCPVIAADADGAREQMGDAAIFVDPSSPDQIAEAILRLHRDQKLRSDLIARGRERATHWTADEFVKGVFKIFDDFEPIRRNWN